MLPPCSNIGKEGLTLRIGERFKIKVFVPRLGFEINSEILVSNVEQDAVTDDLTTVKQRRPVDVADIGAA